MMYENETVKAFSSRKDAEAALKKDVCKWAKVKEKDWYSIPEKLGFDLDTEDIFEPDYVRMLCMFGSKTYFIIEELPLK